MREHVCQKRGQHRIKEQDRSPRTPLRVHQLLWRTEQAGSHIGTFCHVLHRNQGQIAVRRIQGVLAMAKKFGMPAVDKACAVALQMGVHEYRFVKHYLKHYPSTAPLSLQQVDPLIRNLLEYRDLIQQKTKENRRGDRLLERRRKQADFRDSQATLDNFDFDLRRR